MAAVIDMKLMRYINLFSKISHVQTTHCFEYNNQIIFAVPQKFVSKAIGKGAENIKKIKQTVGKRARVIAMPETNDAQGIIKFVEDLVSPVELGKVEVKGDCVFITANRQSKAVIIGRNRTREKELCDILKNSLKIPTLKIL